MKTKNQKTVTPRVTTRTKLHKNGESQVATLQLGRNGEHDVEVKPQKSR